MDKYLLPIFILNITQFYNLNSIPHLISYLINLLIYKCADLFVILNENALSKLRKFDYTICCLHIADIKHYEAIYSLTLIKQLL